MNAPANLDSVLIPLDQRAASRPPDYAAENGLLLWLSDELSRTPDQIFHKLADAAMQLTGAQSAGMFPVALRSLTGHLIKLERDGRARRDGEQWSAAGREA